MADAAIFFDGKVRQTTNLSGITFNNKTGFVTNFTFENTRYTHVLKDKFSSDGINTDQATAGYYDESIFLKYLAKKPGGSITNLTTSKLNLGSIPAAAANDQVRVQFLKIDSPYTDFCTLNKYTWSFNPNAQVLDDSHFSIILQPGYQLSAEKLSLSSISTNFYIKNIGLITNSDFPDNKDQGAYYLSLIALQIHRINKDIFPLFYANTDLASYIATQNQEWQTGTIFNQPTLQDLIDYYTNLTVFYNSAYANQLNIAQAPEKTKLFWLANCLTPQGLTVLSVYDKLYIITQAISLSKTYAVQNVALGVILPTVSPNSDLSWVARISAPLILKIVESVTLIDTQNDDFLAQLITIGNFGISKDETLFEVIYNFLGDNQVGRIIGDNKLGRIVGGIFGNPDDRRKFVDLLNTIWQSSIYNPYYESAKYTQPINQCGVFEESYYMSATGLKHYVPDTASVLFVFETGDTANLISYTSSFDFSLDRNKITAYKVLLVEIHDEHPSSETTKTFYGTYDLYQPVSLIGFKPDLDIAVPKDNCIPIFFLYYANDYKEVKDADARIELLFNIGLNFIGIGEAADLGYLRQISEFGQLRDLPATKAVLSWTAREGVNQAVQLTAGNALAISNYINTTTTDPRLKDFTSKLNIFLGAALFGSVAFDMYAKKQVTLAAIGVNAEYEALKAAQVETNLSENAINAVRAFTDLVEELTAAMRSKIVNLELTHPNTILPKFDAFPKNTQLSFYYDFFEINDPTIWNKLNESYAAHFFDEAGLPVTVTERTLVDAWVLDFAGLEKYRGDIAILEAIQLLDTDPFILEHAIKGSPNIGRPKLPNGKLGNTVVDLTGMHSLTEMVTPPPYVEGKWNFINDEYIENEAGYKVGRVERCMTADDIDPQTQQRWKNPLNAEDRKYIKAKRLSTAIWPYAPPRIKTEMAIAFARKSPLPSGKIGILKFESNASDGTFITIYQDQYGKWSIFPENSKIISK